ncbi:MAG: DUF2793 domain-containing protein [Erythrobacter sp.]
MSDPITFPSSTPALRLPLLIAGQAQKEFFVNQALSLLDALYPRAIDAAQVSPPATPQEGHCFLVTAPAIGAWAGREEQVAVMIGGDWHFVFPSEGMQLFDRSANHVVVFQSQWVAAVAPAVPTGGTVIDIEARAVLTALVDRLRSTGVLSAPTQ